MASWRCNSLGIKLPECESVSSTGSSIESLSPTHQSSPRSVDDYTLTTTASVASSEEMPAKTAPMPPQPLQDRVPERQICGGIKVCPENCKSKADGSVNVNTWKLLVYPSKRINSLSLLHSAVQYCRTPVLNSTTGQLEGKTIQVGRIDGGGVSIEHVNWMNWQHVRQFLVGSQTIIDLSDEQLANIIDIISNLHERPHGWETI